MDPVVREGPNVVELLRNGVTYLFRNSRVEFHPALYVLLYASALVLMLTVAYWALGFLFEPDRAVNYELVGAFTASAAVAELTRGHVKHYLGVPPNEWSFKSIAAGGAALGLTFWVVVLLKWFDPRWHELPLSMGFGATVYLVLGYLFRYEERKKLREGHDT